MMSERHQKSEIISPKITKFSKISDNSITSEMNYSKDLYHEIEKQLKNSIHLITSKNNLNESGFNNSIANSLFETLTKLKLLKREYKYNINFLNNKYKEFKNERTTYDNRINDLMN